jgi:nuclear transport factor 2 (NTF2) superfamily protein
MTENRNKKDEMLIYKEYHSLIHELVKVLWSFKEIVIAVYICFHCFSHIVHHHF